MKRETEEGNKREGVGRSIRRRWKRMEETENDPSLSRNVSLSDYMLVCNPLTSVLVVVLVMALLVLYTIH